MMKIGSNEDLSHFNLQTKFHVHVTLVSPGRRQFYFFIHGGYTERLL